MGENGDFSAIIIRWYELNKRHLPWRQTRDPYLIWLSEVILQQTRIDQGISYYHRFAKKYPNVKFLASSSEDDILKLWQGLGYYSRARNMHHTAKVINIEFSGQFPDSYEQLLSLKGVGEYTAAAISSIAFNLPYAAVDGNVYRVLSRVFGIHEPIDSSTGKKLFQQLATKNMDVKQPGIYNQAIMEFGALHCKPKKPNCPECPLITNCIAYQNGEVEKLPVKKGKAKVIDRYFNYLIIKSGNDTFINKRTKSDIWRNMYEFPQIETPSKTELLDILSELNNVCGTRSVVIEKETNWKKHILSHQRIHYRFFTIRIKEEKNISKDLIKVNKKDIFKFAVPKLIEQELNKRNWF